MTTTTSSRPVMGDRDWRQQGACRAADPELFFPVVESGPAFDEQVEKAKAVCAGCLVRIECRAFALVALPHGIAGGLTADERQELRGTDAAPFLDASGRPIGASRRQTAATGRSQLASGRRSRVVEREFGTSRRTVERWNAEARTSTDEGRGATAATGLPSGPPTQAPSQGPQQRKDAKSR